MRTKGINRSFDIGEKVTVNNDNHKDEIAFIDWPTVRYTKAGQVRDWFISYPGDGESLYLCRFTHERARTHFHGSVERYLVRKSEYIAEKFIKKIIK